MSRASYCGDKWREALDTCHKCISESKFEKLKQIDSSDKLLADLSDFKHAVDGTSGPNLVQRLRPALDPLRSFVTLLAASLGSTTIQTAIVWGVMSLLIHVCLSQYLAVDHFFSNDIMKRILRLISQGCCTDRDTTT